MRALGADVFKGQSPSSISWLLVTLFNQYLAGNFSPISLGINKSLASDISNLSFFLFLCTSRRAQ